jgi:hypothetical protein
MDTQNNPTAPLEFAPNALGYYTQDAVLKLFGITENTLVDWRKRGSGPAYSRRGNQFFYHPDDLRAFIELNRKDSLYVPKVKLG